MEIKREGGGREGEREREREVERERERERERESSGADNMLRNIFQGCCGT